MSKLVLPAIELFSDYHEGDDFVERLGRLSDGKIKGYELGLAFSRNYAFLIYSGRKPGKKREEQIMADLDVELYWDNEE